MRDGNIMNLQCFSKLFSNCKFIKLVTKKQLDCHQKLAAVAIKEESVNIESHSCVDGVCGLTSWRPDKTA
ncbi:hypothetical protein BH11CYA1_BH11CYA1_22310 [soil metagenome]